LTAHNRVLNEEIENMKVSHDKTSKKLKDIEESSIIIPTVLWISDHIEWEEDE
jgi:hypothetical protein